MFPTARLTASPETLDGFSVTSTSPHVIWDIPTRSISLRQQRANRGPRSVRALIGPSPDSWTRGTETQVQNDYFGGTSSSLDWLQFTPQFGIVAARRRSPEWFEVYLQIDTPPENDDACRLLTAVRWAFAFAMGRECAARGHVEFQGQLNEFDRVQNLMNRIVLHLLGYTGPYCDYAQPGWPVAPFPPSGVSNPGASPQQ